MKRIIQTSILLLCGLTASGAELSKPGREHRLPSAAEAAPYIASINDAIRKKMVYPRDHAGKRCTAHVAQEQTGKVVSIRIKECASEQLHQAVERAIALASPLPVPEGHMLFNRHLVLEFVVPTET